MIPFEQQFVINILGSAIFCMFIFLILILCMCYLLVFPLGGGVMDLINNELIRLIQLKDFPLCYTVV